MCNYELNVKALESYHVTDRQLHMIEIMQVALLVVNNLLLRTEMARQSPQPAPPPHPWLNE